MLEFALLAFVFMWGSRFHRPTLLSPLELKRNPDWTCRRRPAPPVLSLDPEFTTARIFAAQAINEDHGEHVVITPV